MEGASLGPFAVVPVFTADMSSQSEFSFQQSSDLTLESFPAYHPNWPLLTDWLTLAWKIKPVCHSHTRWISRALLPQWLYGLAKTMLLWVSWLTYVKLFLEHLWSQGELGWADQDPDTFILLTGQSTDNRGIPGGPGGSSLWWGFLDQGLGSSWLEWAACIWAVGLQEQS